MALGITENSPNFYGSVKVGERGQVVIPAKIRHELNISPSTNMLVFSIPNAKGFAMLKVEAMSEFLKVFATAVHDLEEVLKEVTAEENKTKK